MQQKLDKGFRIVVTGSNATLLSTELGTKLTGRHISTELFPFSYAEFLDYTKQQTNAESALEYFQKGGFPEYLKTTISNVLNQLFDDIIYRNIAVRYKIRDAQALRKLAIYLISNIGKPVSATKLKQLFEVKATSTLLEYFYYLENCYLVQFVPKFSYSLKVQLRNPKKVYCIDLGLFTSNSIVFTEENGRRLENVVYIQLRRKHKEIYYFQEKKECDFIVFEKGKAEEIIQVCYDLNDENLARELDGAIEALHYFEQTRATIVTLNQEDCFNKDGMTIDVVPLHKFLE